MEVATTNNHHHHAHHQHSSSQLNSAMHHHHQHHHQPQRHHATHNQLPLLKRMPQQQQQQQRQQQRQQQQQLKPHNLSLVADTDIGTATTDDLALGLEHGHDNERSTISTTTTTTTTSPRSPFQREVREWQRIDPDTGALLSGRLEADRWINGPLNSYGKKSNSGLSSNSSSSSSSLNDYATPATTTTMHTHNNAGKISLHAIVGSSNNNNFIETKSTWQPNQPQHQQQSQRNSQLFEQVALYGQSNNSSSANNNNNTARVGVADCDDCIAADAHDLLPQPTSLRQATTPTQRQRDLESFRHYALPTPTAKSTTTLSSRYAAAADDDDVIVAANATAIDDADDDDLRLSSRHLRRQQLPFGTQNTLLQRSRSISNDDLSSEWQHTPDTHSSTNTNDEQTASDWRRVSKLRRSFQSTTSNSHSTSTPSRDSFQHTPPASTRSRSRPRPLELPTHSTLRSVSQIRAELEAGRRLNTAMRNNHVDLAALDNILQSSSARGVQKSDVDASKRDSFLTAASLKEIRGKLKKLSDESLYKDDFIAYQQPPAADEQIEVQQSVRKAHTSTPISAAAQRLRQLTPETSPEISATPKSAFQTVTQRQHTDASVASPTTSFLAQRAAHVGPKHATHSLESRQKFKDTNSTEWHLRRKSYGFEKMSPPEGKNMFRMDASTDSGLGRSGEQLGNWSPTEATTNNATHNTRGTVIHFGADVARHNHNTPTTTAIIANTRYRKSPTRMPNANNVDEDDEDERHKRHSIAVDESQYLRDNLRKTSQVHLSGFYEPPGSKSLQLYDSGGAHGAVTTSATLYQRSQQQKRVEFCKTEVHFAAESGRVNIVETDGKPPPTNNFRRRRRTTSGPLQSLVKSAATSAAASELNQSGSVTHFGDDQQPQRHRTIASSVVAYKATLVSAADSTQESARNVTISVPKLSEPHLEGSRSSYASTTSGVDTTDNENDEIAAIRGILKNKPIKPKPYHLGENIDSTDALWGVQLKPIGGGGILSGTRREHDDLPTVNDSNKSVAERVRIAEKRREHDNTNGFSTKINLSMDDAARDWSETDLPHSNVMSIELHSPQTPLEKRNSFKRTQSPPVAKPRNVANIKSSEHPQLHTATTVKQNTDRYPTTTEPIKSSLKIVKEARGARKLREHELSYFGVANAKHEEPISKYPTTTTNTLSSTKRTLPSRKLHDEPSTRATETTTHTTEDKAQTTTKWQLLNDKPDLLRHSPIAVEPQMIRRNAELQERMKDYDDDNVDVDDEHYYENITNEITPVFKVKPPSSTTAKTTTTTTTAKSYDRRRDLERDALILSEMNKSANQTMKALSDEAALKDQRRRSLHRRNSKPLETIDEKTIAEKVNDTCIAVKVARSTYASEAKRTPRHVNTPSPTHRVRTSSQSSVESCPRARSRSLSSEREYENIISTPKPTRSSTAKGDRKSTTKSSNSTQQQQRPSSRESQHSARMQYSSGDEVGRRDDQQRMRTKSKRLGGSSGSNSHSHKHSKDTDERRERQHQHQHLIGKERERERHSQTATSTAHASQREERVECTGAPSSAHTHSHTQRSSSGRRKREELPHTSGSSARHSSTRSAAAEKTEKKHERPGGAGARLLRSLRGHEHDTSSTQQRSHSQRTNDREKSEREREKNKESRTRGHSSHVTTHSNSNNNSSKTTATQSHNNEQRATRAVTTPKAHTRDHKKSSSNTTTTTAATSSVKTHTTHSKNTQDVNTATTSKAQQRPQQQQRHYHEHEEQNDAEHHCQSKSHEKTAIIGTKPREHSTKQRKLF